MYQLRENGKAIYCTRTRNLYWIDRQEGRDAVVELLNKPAAELERPQATIRQDKEMLANDGIVFRECFRLLGMDESGANTTDIPEAIMRLKAALKP